MGLFTKKSEPDMQSNDQEKSDNQHVPMTLTESKVFKTRELISQNEIIIRRVTVLYMTKCMDSYKDWKPTLNTAYKCYEYLNDLVEGHYSNPEYLTDKFCDYFNNTLPCVIMQIMGQELDFYNALTSAHKH